MSSSEATYCRVLPTFWTDPKVKRQLSRDEKYLLLYFMTSPHTNMIGLYYLPLEYAAAEADMPREEIEAMIRGTLARFVTYDWESEEVLVHRAARHQIGNILKAADNRTAGVQRILRDTHSAPLVTKFVALYPDWPVSTPVPAVPPVLSPAPSGEIQPADSDKGLPKPLGKPLRSLSSSSSSSSTGTKLTQGLLLLAGDELEAFVSEVMILANKGMGDNPKIRKTFDPIQAGHGSRQDVIDWVHAGVDPEAIRRVVSERARAYEPSGRNRQISTMKYFTNAVLDEHDRELAKKMQVENGSSGNGSSDRTSGVRRGRGRSAAPVAGKAPDQSARRPRGFGT